MAKFCLGFVRVFYIGFGSKSSLDHRTVGCVDEKPPNCWGVIRDVEFQSLQGFMSRDGFKFSESDNLTLPDCEAKCLHDCSCFAYGPTNEDLTGCEIWSSGAILQVSGRWPGKSRELYVIKSRGYHRMASMPAVLMGEIALAGSGLPSMSDSTLDCHSNDGSDLHIFSFDSIAAASNNFCYRNKLGEGGFGPVYKGKLADGQEVAIKRLSRSSGQGIAEFKNEAMLIAKLQHTNLVRLLGYCIQEDEKLLVYEYMPNKSLDSILFDNAKRKLLNWKRRLTIIEGIAQGLLYLHKYSRLKVIHRDLKASNILLDAEMNPKISDFGMARIFGLNQSETNTNRVVGTYGYMSPEYAFQGLVSIKTDVFSFGVLILEIVSGKKNYGRYHHSHFPLNLIGYAWQLWNESKGLELMDPTMDELCPRAKDEVLRCIHIGLLCVQDHATDRPTTSNVVSMLSNETMPLPIPKQPSSFIGSSSVVDEPSVNKNKSENCSINYLTISMIEPR
ncbi:hypothetical protein COLO4_30391 [Corchorus olitorius]|uniref:non-specific serine/threonine protein kinase n=1 Tax=Corchorus olitorius TaxID=93759 RepID=A0A1R3H8W0_9ROSI|nr:hypothetical protein COLO4_30391 [Corchorus olitorius]